MFFKKQVLFSRADRNLYGRKLYKGFKKEYNQKGEALQTKAGESPGQITEQVYAS